MTPVEIAIALGAISLGFLIGIVVFITVAAWLFQKATLR